LRIADCGLRNSRPRHQSAFRNPQSAIVLNVALTGNIAAGKSTVVDWFGRWGATVVDADELVREAQEPGTAVLTAIAKQFGAGVLAPDGSLDRDALRAKVMGDDAALAELNAIVHPAVRRRREQLMREAAQRGDAIVVNDIPLLFEAMDPDAFDVVVLIDAPVELRRRRLLATRGLSAHEADRMIRAQMPAERKRGRSHLVIENAGSLAELEEAARHAFAQLRRRAALAPEFGWSSVLLVGTGPRDGGNTFRAFASRCADAGIPCRRVTAKSARFARMIQGHAQETCAATVATRAAREAAAAMWSGSGRPGRFYWLDPEPGDSTTSVDLRPWDGQRVLMGNFFA
jgi:dephospho-CoA kinase